MDLIFGENDTYGMGQGEVRICISPDSWLWTDHSQISLTHSPTPPKCSTRAIMALINNLGIVYHQYCSSSYLDIHTNPGPFYHSWQWKLSSNLILTRPPELQSQLRLPTDSDESPKALSTLNSLLLYPSKVRYMLATMGAQKPC